MDRGNAVGTGRNDDGIETLGELAGDELGSHRVSAAGQVRPMLLDASERHHHQSFATDHLGDVR